MRKKGASSLNQKSSLFLKYFLVVKYMKLADGSFELILFYQKMTLTKNSTS